MKRAHQRYGARWPHAGWCAALLLVLQCGPSVAQVNQPEPAEQAQQEKEQPKPSPLPVRIIDGAVRIVEEEAAAGARQRHQERTEKREEDALVVQRSMEEANRRVADAAEKQTLIVSVGTLLLLVTLVLTFFANRAAWAAVTVTREIGEAQARAYVSVVGAEIDIRPKGPTAEKDEISTILRISNSGATPGVNISYYCGSDSGCFWDRDKFKATDVVDYQNYIENLPSGTTKPIPTAAFGVLKSYWRVQDDVARFTEDTQIGDFPILIIRGVVFYDDVFGKTFRSQFCFFVHGNARGHNVMQPIQANVPTFEPIAGRGAFVSKPKSDKAD